MKKTILKSVVATAVVAATMVVSSVAAMAAETITDKATLTFGSGDVMDAKATADETKDFCTYFTTHFIKDKTQISGFKKEVEGISDKNTYEAEFKCGTGKSYIEFTTSKPGIVIIGGRSSNKEVVAIADVVDSEGNPVGSFEGALNGATSFTISKPIVLPKADTYKIQKGASSEKDVNIFLVSVDLTADTAVADNTVAVKANDGKYYAIAVVSKATAEEAATLNLNEDSTDTVYTSVQLGEDTYTAADLGGTAEDYVYATEVTLDGTDYANKTASDIQGKIKVTVE